MRGLFFLIYSLVYSGALTLMLPRELSRRQGALRAQWLRERTGRIPSVSDRKRKRAWIHAVSVGEAVAARPLIEAMRKDWAISVSTVTDTGRKVVSGFLRDDEVVFYLPFDLPFTVKKTLKSLRPDLLVIMETEIWPCLLMIPPDLGVRVVIVNGRISDASFRNYIKVRSMIRWFLSDVSHFCMQSRRDAERIIALGAPPERVTVTGNLKFEIRDLPEVPAWSRSHDAPLVVAGSTHQGEEELLVRTYVNLRAEFPDLRMIIAPRHPERAAEVEALLQGRGIKYGRKTKGATVQEMDLVILDTVGELCGVYGAGDICVIGGSFIPRGGHSIYEPAAWGKPVLTGPYMDNFPLAEEFFRAGGAIRTDGDGLEEAIRRLLKSHEERRKLGRKAFELYRKHEGALEKTLRVINGT